jgi:hypothetical protein
MITWLQLAIAYELFSGRQAFFRDFEVFQHHKAKNNSKYLVRDLELVGKFYVEDLLELCSLTCLTRTRRGLAARASHIMRVR